MSIYGRVHLWPVIEIQDSASLVEYNHIKGKAFCYSLMAPKDKSSNNDMMLMMQNDLRSYFGWNVQLETR